jgi:hypothetical protein
MDLHVRFAVDPGHCQRALDEVGAMLVRQERAFLQRWYGRWPSAALVRGLSVFGMVVSGVGLGLSAMTNLTRWMPIFLVFIVAFEALRRFSEKLLGWMYARSMERAGRRGPLRAVRFVRPALRLAPFDADFSMQGDLLTYSRNKDGRWEKAWHRHLAKFSRHGVAMQGHHVIAIFARSTALFPSVVILSDGSDELPLALRALGLRTVWFETE